MASGNTITTLTSKPNAIPPPSSLSSQILPAALESHGLRCRDETPASVRRLLSRGQLAAEDFLESSPDIERTLVEAFVEDDYDGRLHLMTLSATTAGESGENATETVGIAFWREVPSEEMAEWLDLRRISKAVADGNLNSRALGGEHDEELSHDAKESMKLVRSDSVEWIQNALRPRPRENDTDDGAPTAPIERRPRPLPSELAIQELTHAWIKIELLAVKRTHRAHRLGCVLLGCTLLEAHALRGNKRAVLHVAGGGASKNVPAARLYARYGFAPVPRHGEGGPFVEPDGDLFVLGNIGRTLRALPWEQAMGIGGGASAAMEYGDVGKGQKKLLQHQSDSYGRDAEDDSETKEITSFP